jgi:rubrerythrin
MSEYRITKTFDTRPVTVDRSGPGTPYIREKIYSGDIEELSEQSPKLKRQDPERMCGECVVATRRGERLAAADAIVRALAEKRPRLKRALGGWGPSVHVCPMCGRWWDNDHPEQHEPDCAWVRARAYVERWPE